VTADAPEARAEGHGVAFWVGLVVGGAVMAVGVRGVLDQAAGTDPGALLVWVVGADLVHDLVLAPVAILVGWLVGRRVRGPWRAPVQAALVASGIVLLVGWPLLRGYGRDTRPDNPTVAPLDYSTAVLTVLAVVWVGALAWGGVRTWRARRAP
jgi:hypothetical protein